MSDENNLGTLIVDPFASQASVEEVLMEIARMCKRRDYLLQMGFSRRTREHRIILARVTGAFESVACAEIETINPVYVKYRLLGERALPTKLEVMN